MADSRADSDSEGWLNTDLLLEGEIFITIVNHYYLK
jgi:hypothetical protein